MRDHLQKWKAMLRAISSSKKKMMELMVDLYSF